MNISSGGASDFPLLWAHAPPLDHCDYDSSVESCNVLPSEVVGLYDELPGAAGFAEAPEDGPPFQFYCLLLSLSYNAAVDFEYAC